MPDAISAQLRLIYSLLRPAVRVAARFHVPVRTLAELLRLAYFESLQEQGLTQAAIALRMGQTERHMRSLAGKLKTDFFAAEQEIGDVRAVENVIAARQPTREGLAALLPSMASDDLDRALQVLEQDARVESAPDGTLRVAQRYVVLSSERFQHRIDALNHYLEGAYRAILQRLVFDDRTAARVKTISFTAQPAALVTFLAGFEGRLRSEIADLEERAVFDGETEHRYTIGITCAKYDDP